MLDYLVASAFCDDEPFCQHAQLGGFHPGLTDVVGGVAGRLGDALFGASVDVEGRCFTLDHRWDESLNAVETPSTSSHFDGSANTSPPPLMPALFISIETGPWSWH
jgi:hypothetical protein